MSQAQLALELAHQANEPILKVSNERYTVFPVKYQKIWDNYKLQQKMFWVADEIKYTDDLKSWSELDTDEQKFIKHVLAFFANTDSIVNQNLMENFMQEIQIQEAQSFYSAQAYIENVHAETYARLIDTFIKDPEEKDYLLHAIDNIPSIKKKAEWAIKWLDRNNSSIYRRVVAFAVVEGVFFSGAFCSIFWLMSRHRMTKALGVSNQFIARDETLHCNNAIDIYNLLEYKLPEEIVHEIFAEAVEIEIEFITEALPCRLIGMNSDLMTEYIKYTSNYWLQKLGYGLLYPEATKDPFDFMVLNQIEGKSNFFETLTTEYSNVKEGTLTEVDF